MNKVYLNIYYKNNYAELEIKAGQWTANTGLLYHLIPTRLFYFYIFFQQFCLLKPYLCCWILILVLQIWDPKVCLFSKVSIVNDTAERYLVWYKTPLFLLCLQLFSYRDKRNRMVILYSVRISLQEPCKGFI